MQNPEESKKKPLTHFQSTKRLDNCPVLVPYPDPEQLAQLVIPLYTANPSGKAHARTAIKIWEECYVEIARHRAGQERVLAKDEDIENWRKLIHLEDDDVFPMNLDCMLGRLIYNRSKKDRMELFKRHIRELPVITPTGNVRGYAKTGKPLLRSPGEVKQFVKEVATLRSRSHYEVIAQPFQKWLMTLKSQRSKMGGQAKAAQKQGSKKIK